MPRQKNQCNLQRRPPKSRAGSMEQKSMAMATTHVPPPRLSYCCSVAETDFESLQWTPPADFHSIIAQRRHRNIPSRTISSVGGGNHKASFATITVGTSYSTAVCWVARHQHVFYLGLSPSSLLLFVVAVSLSTSAASLPFDSDGAAIAIVVVVVAVVGSRCLTASIVAFCSRRCVSTTITACSLLLRLLMLKQRNPWRSQRHSSHRDRRTKLLLTCQC